MNLTWIVVILASFQLISTAATSPDVKRRRSRQPSGNGNGKTRHRPGRAISPPLPPWQRCFEFIVDSAQDVRQQEFAIIRDLNGQNATLLRSFLAVNIFKWIRPVPIVIESADGLEDELEVELPPLPGTPPALIDYVLELKTVQSWRVSNLKQKQFNAEECRFRSFLFDTIRGACDKEGTMSEMDAAILNILLVFKLFLATRITPPVPPAAPIGPVGDEPATPLVHFLGTNWPIPTWVEFNTWLNGPGKQIHERYESAARQLADFIEGRKVAESKQRHVFDIYNVLFTDRGDSQRAEAIWRLMDSIHKANISADLPKEGHPVLDIWQEMKTHYALKGRPLKPFNSSAITRFEVICRMAEMLNEARLETGGRPPLPNDIVLLAKPTQKFWDIFREFPILKRQLTPSLSVESSDTRYNDSTEDLDESGVEQVVNQLREELNFDKETWTKLDKRFLHDADGHRIDVYLLFEWLRCVVVPSRRRHDDEISYDISVRFPARPQKGAIPFPRWSSDVEPMFWILADNFRLAKTSVAMWAMILHLLIHAHCRPPWRADISAEILLLKGVYFYYLAPHQLRADLEKQPGALNFIQMIVHKYTARELPPLHVRLLGFTDKRFNVAAVKLWNSVKTFSDENIKRLGEICEIEKKPDGSFTVNVDANKYKIAARTDMDLKRFVERLHAVTSRPLQEDSNKLYNVTRSLLSVYVSQYRNKLVLYALLEMPIAEALNENSLKAFHFNLDKNYKTSALPRLAKKIIKLRQKYSKMARNPQEPGDLPEYITDNEDSDEDTGSSSSSNDSSSSSESVKRNAKKAKHPSGTKLKRVNFEPRPDDLNKLKSIGRQATFKSIERPASSTEKFHPIRGDSDILHDPRLRPPSRVNTRRSSSVYPNAKPPTKPVFNPIDIPLTSAVTLTRKPSHSKAQFPTALEPIHRSQTTQPVKSNMRKEGRNLSVQPPDIHTPKQKHVRLDVPQINTSVGQISRHGKGFSLPQSDLSMAEAPPHRVRTGRKGKESTPEPLSKSTTPRSSTSGSPSQSVASAPRKLRHSTSEQSIAQSTADWVERRRGVSPATSATGDFLRQGDGAARRRQSTTESRNAKRKTGGGTTDSETETKPSKKAKMPPWRL